MRSAKAPDLNAPRFRKKTYGTLNKKFIKELKREVPELKNISDEEIVNVVRKFNKLICDTVINVRDGVELPEQLGHMFIGSCKPMKSNVDFKTSTAYLKKIQHRNWESDAYVAKIFYTATRVFYSEKKNRYNFKNHEIWAFNGCRRFTRSVAKEFPKNWKKYIEIDPTKKLQYIYRQDYFKTINKLEEQYELKTYNPLEI